jgi:23S rRNA pseudouridine1911/1915/1917 synthase
MADLQFELYSCNVPAAANGQRLDTFLEGALTGCSRSLVAKCIKAGHCQVVDNSGKPWSKIKPASLLSGNECIEIAVPIQEPLRIEPETGDLDVLYEDDSLLVVNKAAGVVVHPAIGHANGTLLNIALGYGRSASQPFEPKLIHRLDGETSGVIALAKTRHALDYYQDQFRQRTTKKWYAAIVHGAKHTDAVHQGALGRHPKDFRKRAVVAADVAGARSACSAWHFLERYPRFGYSVCCVRIYTGRTHQIRVHLNDRRAPLLADGLYGHRAEFRALDGRELRRQALHAWALELQVLDVGVQRFTVPLPDDLRQFTDVSSFSAECMPAEIDYRESDSEPGHNSVSGQD